MKQEKNRNLFYILLGLSAVLFYNVYKPMFGPLIMGALFAYVLYPLVNLLKNKTMLDHAQASIVVFLGAVISLVLLVFFSTPFVVGRYATLESVFANVAEEVIELEPDLNSFLGFSFPLESVVMDLQVELNQFLDPDRMFRVISTATGNIVWLIVILATTFFLIKDWELFRDWIYHLFPKKARKDVRIVQDQIKVVWQSYLRGQLLMMLLIGSLSIIGGFAVGLWGAFVMGLIAGGLALIPNFGPALATLIAGIVAWTRGSSYIDVPNIWFALIVIAIYTSIQIMEGVWFQPQIMSKRLHIHPGVIIIAVIATLTQVGALAGLIVVPVLGSLEVLIQFFRSKNKEY